MSIKKIEHRGTATVRLAGEDIEKIFREAGSAWIVHWMSRIHHSARLSEIKSETNVNGGSPTLVLIFTVPHDELEENKGDIRFIGSTDRERARTIAAAAVDHVLSWLEDDASAEIEEQADGDILVIGDDPVASELQAIVETMTKRKHQMIEASFERAARLLEKGHIRKTLIDLATEDICGDDRSD